MDQIWVTLLGILASAGSAVLVAVLNNWDKINKSKRELKDSVKQMNTKVKDLQSTVNEFHNALEEDKREREAVLDRLDTLTSAERTNLQTTILADCKKVQQAINKGDIDYSEDLKQLIILYREYWLCNFNSQGKLYFNDTISKAADHNNVLTHELMNTYFPEYDPD